MEGFREKLKPLTRILPAALFAGAMICAAPAAAQETRADWIALDADANGVADELDALLTLIEAATPEQLAAAGVSTIAVEARLSRDVTRADRRALRDLNAALDFEFSVPTPGFIARVAPERLSTFLRAFRDEAVIFLEPVTANVSPLDSALDPEALALSVAISEAAPETADAFTILLHDEPGAKPAVAVYERIAPRAGVVLAPNEKRRIAAAASKDASGPAHAALVIELARTPEEARALTTTFDAEVRDATSVHIGPEGPEMLEIIGEGRVTVYSLDGALPQTHNLGAVGLPRLIPTRRPSLIVQRDDGATFTAAAVVAPEPTPAPTPLPTPFPPRPSVPRPAPLPTPTPAARPEIPLLTAHIQPRPFTELDALPVTDGFGDDVSPPLVLNNIAPADPRAALANLRAAHDNNFFFLHIAAQLPVAPADRAAIWILMDATGGTGANTLPNLPLAVPEEISAALARSRMENTVFPETVLLLENHSTPSPEQYHFWSVSLEDNTAEQWALLELAGTGRVRLTNETPVGFEIAFSNSGGWRVPQQSVTAISGLELRMPLSAFGLKAPLRPRTPPVELRFVTALSGDTPSGWSNQILRPVPLTSVERLTEGPVDLRAIPETQTVVYTISYVPFPRTDDQP